MFVERSMTREVITIDARDNIFKAQEAMAAGGIRHLPVVDAEGRLIGMVTDRDVRSALPFELFKGTGSPEERRKTRDRLAVLKVEDIMTTDLVKVTANDTIQDALLLIQRHKVGALPVVDSRQRLKGIISVRDLMRAFINVLGIGEAGTLLGVLVEEKVGQLKRIVDAITEEEVSFGSILVARYWDQEMRAVFINLRTINVVPIKRKLKAMGYALIDPMDWMLDELRPEKA